MYQACTNAMDSWQGGTLPPRVLSGESNFWTMDQKAPGTDTAMRLLSAAIACRYLRTMALYSDVHA